MKNLQPDDLTFIINRLPKDLQKFMREHRVYLAGGCIRSIISGDPISDYDLFGPSRSDLKKWARDLAAKRQGRIYSTDNAFTVLAPPRTPVQFIFRWLFNEPGEVVHSFDFSIAQAVVWFEPGPTTVTYPNLLPVLSLKLGRWRSLCSKDFYPDLAAKRLRYTQPERNEDAGGSLLRVTKFLRKGYNIAPESLGKVIARLVSRVNFDQIQEIVGRDRTGATDIYEQELATVIIALLREVDPLRVVDGVEVVDAEQGGEEEDI